MPGAELRLVQHDALLSGLFPGGVLHVVPTDKHVDEAIKGYQPVRNSGK
jgi:hypothetical protein